MVYGDYDDDDDDDEPKGKDTTATFALPLLFSGFKNVAFNEKNLKRFFFLFSTCLLLTLKVRQKEENYARVSAFLKKNATQQNPTNECFSLSLSASKINF